jgi:hypothetical protein
MRQVQNPVFGSAQRRQVRAPLDLVVPFTTPRLTEAALTAAQRLGAGLDSSIRVVKVQVVPFPLDLRFPPVPVDFLEARMSHFCGEASCEIRFAREFEAGLRGTLRYRSMVVLAAKRRPWRTRTERLADSLRRAGYTVVMVDEEELRGARRVGPAPASAIIAACPKEHQHA